MSLPLDGYRVIELAQIYAGPYCGLQLAHFGAEVIKVEPPGTGELLRRRPPAKHGTNYGFLMLNTGKKSVSLNLKDPRGRDIFFRMLADSDVLLENYAPGALERLGLGYDDLAPRFPRLVFASSKGYGRDSRFAELGAMDFTIQAASGIISMTGYADRPGVRVPPRSSTPVPGCTLSRASSRLSSNGSAPAVAVRLRLRCSTCVCPRSTGLSVSSRTDSKFAALATAIPQPVPAIPIHVPTAKSGFTA